jgi:hypothetical protein
MEVFSFEFLENRQFLSGSGDVSVAPLSDSSSGDLIGLGYLKNPKEVKVVPNSVGHGLLFSIPTGNGYYQIGNTLYFFQAKTKKGWGEKVYGDFGTGEACTCNGIYPGVDTVTLGGQYYMLSGQTYKVTILGDTMDCGTPKNPPSYVLKMPKSKIPSFYPGMSGGEVGKSEFFGFDIYNVGVNGKFTVKVKKPGKSTWSNVQVVPSVKVMKNNSSRVELFIPKSKFPKWCDVRIKATNPFGVGYSIITQL